MRGLLDVTDHPALLEMEALAQKNNFIKGFTEKLLCYALGRPIAYGDHVTVDKIISDTAKNGHRLQDILQATVASNYFQTR